MTRRPGLYADVPEAEYHADPAVSQSSLKTLLRSPRQYLLEQAMPSEPTPTMLVGTLTHALVLDQPHEFVAFEHDGRTAAGKKERAEAKESGVQALPMADFQRARAMSTAVLADKEARALLEQAPAGYRELSMWWTDPESGIDCRGRIDALTPGGPVDLKTTADASPGAFARSCVTYGYHLQTAHYEAGLAALDALAGPMRFVAVESTWPHLVAVYQLDGEFTDRGAQDVRRALDLLAGYREHDTWPAFAGVDGPTTLQHPYTRK